MRVLDAEEAKKWLQDRFFYVTGRPLELFVIYNDGDRKGNITRPVMLDELTMVLAVELIDDGFDDSYTNITFGIFAHEQGLAFVQYDDYMSSGGTSDSDSQRDFMPGGTFETLMKFCATDSIREIAYSVLGKAIVE